MEMNKHQKAVCPQYVLCRTRHLQQPGTATAQVSLNRKGAELRENQKPYSLVVQVHLVLHGRYFLLCLSDCNFLSHVDSTNVCLLPGLDIGALSLGLCFLFDNLLATSEVTLALALARHHR